jgi:hypothetical protein
MACDRLTPFLMVDYYYFNKSTREREMIGLEITRVKP